MCAWTNTLELIAYSISIWFVSFRLVWYRLDYSEVHNIDDSDDEPFIEQRNTQQNMRQMPSSHSAKIDIKLPHESYGNAPTTFDEDSKFRKHSSVRSNSQYRNHLKNVLQKQSASKIHRFFAIKRSIKWYVCHLITNHCAAI